MNKPILTLLICIAMAGGLAMLVGCKSVEPFVDTSYESKTDINDFTLPLSNISPLFDTSIPLYKVDNVSVAEALHLLESSWRTHSNSKQLPVSFSASPKVESKKISFAAQDLPIRKLLHIIAEYSGSVYSDEGLTGSVRLHNKQNPAPYAPSNSKLKWRLEFIDFKPNNDPK